MESELLLKINELMNLCKCAVEEQHKGEAGLSDLNHMLARSLKTKNCSTSRKKLRTKLQAVLSEAECLQEKLLNIQSKISEIKSVEYKIKISKGPRHLRRGVLMSLLQENAKSIPLWAGKVDEPPPPLCGAIEVSTVEDYVSAGDHVSALVPDLEAQSHESGTKESWILAEVISYNAESQSFQVDDVDAEEGNLRYLLDKSKVILLPKWKANPVINPEAVFSKGHLVLALYPQTTCFYRAIVDTSPVHAQDEYSLYFEDPGYPDGYAPAIRIPQRYVIACPDSGTNVPSGLQGSIVPKNAHFK